MLHHIPDLKAFCQGHDVLLGFENDVRYLLQQSSKYSEAVHLAKATNMIRQDMLQHTSSFTGTFSQDDLEQAVPQSLLQFVSMIEHGADIISQLQHGLSKSDIPLSHVMLYNRFTMYKEDSNTHRHSKNRETPFAVYIGLSVFAKTIKRQLIHMLHANGISVSYDSSKMFCSTG